eukprot:CAMPEP_0115593628 /NCGR_PEP_ID=MMETSP0272-20121206/11396_1 /TAXON_ID=71861 /ORGANISM="Scrippsiella trochoidea, Strain CCMP3099" /LENGTH=41 /DNA_ID= /DNA_START= /DNA_END= /DNA_ORIENTATION=
MTCMMPFGPRHLLSAIEIPPPKTKNAFVEPISIPVVTWFNP